MSNYEASSPSYQSLVRIGTRPNASNHKNRINLNTSDTRSVGVSIEQRGEKKAMRMEVIVPLSRTRHDSRRTARLELNGSQARRLFETLSRFYSERDGNI
jgi:hypothetical protein